MGTSTPTLNLYKPDDTELVDVEVHLGDNYDKIDQAFEDLDDIPEGKLWRTTGFTGALDAAGEAIPFDDSRVVNGMATGVNGDGLVVPSSGMYDVTLNGYGSGGGSSAVVQFTAIRVRAATSNRNVCLLTLAKTSANDVAGSFTDNIPLQAGDEIRVLGSATDSAVNGWGVDEVSGIRLHVRKTGVLGGATPV